MALLIEYAHLIERRKYYNYVFHDIKIEMQNKFALHLN